MVTRLLLRHELPVLLLGRLIKLSLLLLLLHWVHELPLLLLALLLLGTLLLGSLKLKQLFRIVTQLWVLLDKAVVDFGPKFAV